MFVELRKVESMSTEHESDKLLLRRYRSDFTDKEIVNMPFKDFNILSKQGYLEYSPDEAGWLARHPEDQVEVDFGELLPPDAEMPEDFPTKANMFRELSPMEELEFRQHARATYVIGDPINSLFHPVWRDEAAMMNKEVAAESMKERSGR